MILVFFLLLLVFILPGKNFASIVLPQDMWDKIVQYNLPLEHEKIISTVKDLRLISKQWQKHAESFIKYKIFIPHYKAFQYVAEYEKTFLPPVFNNNHKSRLTHSYATKNPAHCPFTEDLFRMFFLKFMNKNDEQNINIKCVDGFTDLTSIIASPLLKNVLHFYVKKTKTN